MEGTMDENKVSDASKVDPTRVYPCNDCGYTFDHVSHGARVCPKCAADERYPQRIFSEWLLTVLTSEGTKH
jgi:rubrerythrin